MRRSDPRRRRTPGRNVSYRDSAPCTVPAGASVQVRALLMRRWAHTGHVPLLATAHRSPAGVLIATRHEMPVRGEHQGCVLVAQPFGYRVDAATRVEERAGVVVPQVVARRPLGQPGVLDSPRMGSHPRRAPLRTCGGSVGAWLRARLRDSPRDRLVAGLGREGGTPHARAAHRARRATSRCTPLLIDGGSAGARLTPPQHTKAPTPRWGPS